MSIRESIKGTDQRKPGLSAVRKLIEWESTDDRRSLYSAYISEIINSEKAEDLFGKIGEMLVLMKLENKNVENNNQLDFLKTIDLEMARLWYISKLFTDIIERIGVRVAESKDDKGLLLPLRNSKNLETEA